MNDSLEFTAAFIIIAQWFTEMGRPLWPMLSVEPGEKHVCESQEQRRQDTGKINRGQKKKKGLIWSRPQITVLWFLVLDEKPDPWLYTEGLVTALWTEYDPFDICKGTFDNPRDYCKRKKKRKEKSVHCFDGWSTRSMSTALGVLQCTFTFPNTHQCHSDSFWWIHVVLFSFFFLSG